VPAALYYPQTFFFLVPGTHFCQRLSKPQGLVWLEGLGKLKKFNDLTGYNLLAYSIAKIFYLSLIQALLKLNKLMSF
jgi:hypothetical protein